MLYERTHLSVTTRRQGTLRPCKNIQQKGTRHATQRHLPIDAAKGEVIDLVAERRNIRPLGGVQIDYQDVLSCEVDVRCQVKGKRRVTSFIFTEPYAIDPHRRCQHRALKIDENMPAARLGGQLESPPIHGYEFVGFVIETVPRQGHVRVRQNHTFKCGVVEILFVCRRNDRAVVPPVAVDRQNYSAVRGGSAGLSRISLDSPVRQGRTSQYGSSGS